MPTTPLGFGLVDMITLLSKFEALTLAAPSFRWRVNFELMILDKVITSSMRARNLTGPAL